jgi:hypothetical protein
VEATAAEIGNNGSTKEAVCLGLKECVEKTLFAAFSRVLPWLVSAET